MQTNFSTEQLTDRRLAEADRILKRCVHCGLCTAVCSTYVVLGDERDSPRGRIYLMKDMFERERVPTPKVRLHLDRCLSCLSCVSACPSGVDYMHLIDLARVHVEETTTAQLQGARRSQSARRSWFPTRTASALPSSLRHSAARSSRSCAASA